MTHGYAAQKPTDRPADIGRSCRVAESTAVLTGQLDVLYAEPAEWGRGHGTALLRRVQELVAADGHTGSLLWGGRRQRPLDRLL